MTTITITCSTAKQAKQEMTKALRIETTQNLAVRPVAGGFVVTYTK